MSTKDTLTLVLSGLALIVSLVSAWYSAKRQEVDAERQFRGRLTDIGVALIDSVVKVQKINAIPFADRTADHWNDRGMELQRMAALARQADRLITKDTERLLTDVDYLTLAQAFVMDGDWFLADQYWERTLTASNRPAHSAVNKSNYAWYLFTRRRPDDARTQYESAVIDLANSIDREGDAKYIQLGWFHESWMRMEAQFGFPDHASMIRERARDVYEHIGNERERASRISYLDASFDRVIKEAAAATLIADRSQPFRSEPPSRLPAEPNPPDLGSLG